MNEHLSAPYSFLVRYTRGVIIVRMVARGKKKPTTVQKLLWMFGGLLALAVLLSGAMIFMPEGEAPIETSVLIVTI
jgi:hypothetical protein